MVAFTGQVAVVTGASSGIGKAISLGLARQGAALCLVGRSLKTLEAVADSARVTAPRVLCYRVDLTLDEDMRQLAASIQRDFGHVDVLIHSAGVISGGRIEVAPAADFDWQYRTNVRAPYVLTQALLHVSCQSQSEIGIKRAFVEFVEQHSGNAIE